MRNIVFAAALVAFARVATADVSIVGNHQRVSVDCAKDPNVSILGNHAGVTLTGTCAEVTASGNHATVTGSAVKVTVRGNHNTVLLDAVDALAVPGNHNTASWKRTVDPKKRKPKIGGSGKFNRISQAR